MGLGIGHARVIAKSKQVLERPEAGSGCAGHPQSIGYAGGHRQAAPARGLNLLARRVCNNAINDMNNAVGRVDVAGDHLGALNA